MKTDRTFALALVRAVTALTLGGVISVLAQTETPLPSTVVRLKGHARCSTDGGASWRLIKVGELINPGSTIQTALQSDLDVLLGEEVKLKRSAANADLFNPEIHPGNVVRLGADSTLRIDKLTRKPAEGSKESVEEIMLTLRSGTMLGSVRKRGSESKYEVAFTGGVAGMRHAVYGLSAKGELSVLKGTAYIALEDGKPATVVAAEQQFNPSTGLITKLPRPSSSSPPDSQARPEPDRKRTATSSPPPPPPRPRPPASVTPP